MRFSKGPLAHKSKGRVFAAPSPAIVVCLDDLDLSRLSSHLQRSGTLHGQPRLLEGARQ